MKVRILFFLCMTVLLIWFSSALFAQEQKTPQQGERGVRIPSPASQTIPASVQVEMARVEIRLANLEAGQRRIESRLESFLFPVYIMWFIGIVAGLLIPTLAGAWFLHWLKSRRAQ